MKVYHTSNSDNWATPKHVYNYLNGIHEFKFDPCPLGALERGYNGLEVEWDSSNFVNPPYSNIKDFITKGIEEHSKGKKVIYLIPARTDTKNFERLYEYGCKFTFIIGRLRFNESKNSAPFPSVIVELVGNGINEINYIKRDDMKW